MLEQNGFNLDSFFAGRDRTNLEKQMNGFVAKIVFPNSLKAFDDLEQSLVAMRPSTSKSGSKKMKPFYVYPKGFVHFIAAMAYLLWFQPNSQLHSWKDWKSGKDALEQFLKIPAMPPYFVKFVDYLVTCSNFHPSTSLLALYFIEKLKLNCGFDSIATGSEYRIFAVALFIAHTVTEDQHYEMANWNQQCSLFHFYDFKQMHFEFLKTIDYKLYVPVETFARWVLLLNSAQRCFLCISDARVNHRPEAARQPARKIAAKQKFPSIVHPNSIANTTSY